MPAERYKVIGYWRDRQEEWLDRYEGLDEGTLASLRAVWDTTDDEELGRDLYEERLAQLGL